MTDSIKVADAMAVFQYQAYDLHGQTITGQMEADNQAMVAADLRRQDFWIIDIIQEKRKLRSFFSEISIRPVRSRDLAFFCRQLGTLLNSGIAMLEALRNASPAIGEKPAVQSALAGVIAGLKNGLPLAELAPAEFKRFPQNAGLHGGNGRGRRCDRSCIDPSDGAL